MQLPPAQITYALKRLGVSPEEIQAIRRASSVFTGKEALEALKKKTKQRFKRLALELHPDATGGDDDKEEEFKVIRAVVDEINKLTVQERPIARPTFVRVNGLPSFRMGYGSASTSTSATASFGFQPHFTIFVRR